ncbi:Lon protease 2, peroxisomal, partial [Neolecta irregularis DAH-3]
RPLALIPAEAVDPHNPAALALLASLKQLSLELLAAPRSPKLPAALASRLQQIIARTGAPDAGRLCDIIVSSLDAPFAKKLEILRETPLQSRLDKAVQILSHQVTVLNLSKKITSTVDANLSKSQKEYYLRQQLNAIRAELGEKDGKDGDDLDLLEKKLQSANLSEQGRVAHRELARLRRMHPTQPEYNVCITYLETLSEIPWNTTTSDNLDLSTVSRAREQLDADHYGLEKVKKRLLEYLAVLRLKKATNSNSVDKAPILLLVGPPGTGKTSLAKSIAKSIGRKFLRISLGGVRDEAEIRGHRRTYVGAMPGVIVQGLRKIQVCNPVDKLSVHNFHGDPSAAMLEVLDPEQNFSFTDHYINVPVDLSRVLFIATANSLDTISAPLLDRMEVIHLSGYTYHEKLHIAKQHLVSKQVKENGLERLSIEDDALMKIATDLERQIAAICRYIAVESTENPNASSTTITVDDIPKILGIEKYTLEITERSNRPGVVTGLAYMAPGTGGILFIESTSMPGSGVLRMTGNLGKVIEESALCALSWVKSHAFQLHLTALSSDNLLKDRDVHLHCPDGAIAKDGPSAGIAMTLAFISLFSGKSVDSTIAMTGEITLRGQVLPVGGIKEKVLGAHRAGCRLLILPERNRAEYFGDVPEQVIADLQVQFVKSMWDVVSVVWPCENVVQGVAVNSVL